MENIFFSLILIAPLGGHWIQISELSIGLSEATQFSFQITYALLILIPFPHLS
jgi:hypothetical protein